MGKIDSLTIRDAVAGEVDDLSLLAMRSKAHWGYSPEFMAACRAELTVSVDDLGAAGLDYRVAETDSTLVGFYVLEHRGAADYELEALFVEPAFIGRGVGRALLDHARRAATAAGGKRLLIQGDPHAEAFYRAAGGNQIGTRESGSLAGRPLPVFAIALENRDAP